MQERKETEEGKEERSGIKKMNEAQKRLVGKEKSETISDHENS